jgi:outer membrane protein assembly factor BamB
MKNATTVYCKIFRVKGLKMKGLKMGHVSLPFVVALLILAGAAGAIGAIGSTTLAGASSMSTSSPENIFDWPMFHHDPARGGYSESRAPNSSNLVWNFKTGGSPLYSSPAIVNGRVYIGALNGKVYCINSENGAFIWSYTTGNVILSSPASAYGKVYVGSNDSNLYCLNAENGAPIWSFGTDSSLASSPSVVNGRVYIGSYPKIYCINAENGAFLWSYTTGGRIDSSPAVVDNKVYFGSYDSKVYCLNAENGALIWSFTTGSTVYSSPAVENGKVYVGSYDSKVYCLNAENGALIWVFRTGNYIYSSPAVAYGKVYFGSKDTKFYCLNAENGAQIWNFATGNRVFSSPAVADGKVYFGSCDFKIYCLNAENGASIWDFTTDSQSIFSSPAVADGKVYIGSYQETVYCFGTILVKKIIYPTADVYAFGRYSRSQLKFDISSIPSGSNILSANLWMYRFAADGWNGDVTLSRVDNQLWGETITASGFDAQTLTNVENYASKFTSHGWDNLNVLNQLKVDHDIGHTYASFRLRCTNDNGYDPSSGVNDGRFLAIESQPDNLLIVFNSREYDNQDPYLEVTYIPP